MLACQGLRARSEDQHGWHKMTKWFSLPILSMDANCVLTFMGREFILIDCSPCVLEVLHAAHQGVTNMLADDADWVYLPVLSFDVCILNQACA